MTDSLCEALQTLKQWALHKDYNQGVVGLSPETATAWWKKPE